MSFPTLAETVFEGGGGGQPGVGVTIIVTLYNYARYIKEALDSAARQTHRNLELVVVNDRSSDDSEAVALAWLKQHGGCFTRALLLTNADNYGLSISRNIAFAAAANEFIFVLDADNMLYPPAAAKLLAACINSGAQAAYSQIELFDEMADIGSAYTWDPQHLAGGNYIDAMALIRKSAWAAVGGYDPFDTGWEDYDLWCKFVEHGYEGVFVPQILCRYRVHDTSMLRLETNVNVEKVITELVVRHPWLTLR